MGTSTYVSDAKKKELIQTLTFFANEQIPYQDKSFFQEKLVIKDLVSFLPQLVKSKNKLVGIKKYEQDKQKQVNKLKQIIALKDGNLNEYKKYWQSFAAAEKQILELRSYKQFKQNQITQFQQQIYGNVTDLQRQLLNCKSQKSQLSNEVTRLSQQLASKKSQYNNQMIQKNENLNKPIYSKTWKSSPNNQSLQPRTLQQRNNSISQDSKKITDLQNQLRKNKWQKQQLIQEVNQLNEQLLKSNNYNFGNQQNQLMNGNSKDLNNLILQLESKLKKKEQEINNLKDNLNQKEQALQNIQMKISQIQQGKLWAQQQVAKQNNDFSKQKQQYQKDIRNLQKQLEEQKRISHNLNKEAQRMKGQAQKTLKQLDSQKRISGNLTNEIKNLRAQAHKTLQHLNDQKAAISFNLNKEIQRLKGQTQNTYKQLENQKRISGNLTNEIKGLRAQLQRISKQLKDQKAISYNLSNKISKVSRYESLFTGDVVDQQNKCKQYLTTILQKKTERRISKTKLIYRFDPYSKSNFHQYFDNKEQLVLLVRTSNDLIFGGWTEGGFIPKTKSDKSGLLFSLTKEQCFELSQPNRKAITYDQFHIIFGNSEIVIQSLKKQVSSKFGIPNGFYDCRGYTVDLMLGAGEASEVQIKTYELFQLIFE